MIRKPLEEENLFAAMGRLLGLRYEYEREYEINAPAQHIAQNNSVLDLSSLSAELREELGLAAEALDMVAANRIVMQILESSPGLAAELNALIQTFRFDRIVDLCNAVGNGA